MCVGVTDTMKTRGDFWKWRYILYEVRHETGTKTGETKNKSDTKIGTKTGETKNRFDTKTHMRPSRGPVKPIIDPRDMNHETTMSD